MGCEASRASNEKPQGDPNTPTHVTNFPPVLTNQHRDTSRESANEKREEEFIKEAVDVHNEFRKDHGVPPIEHCAKLTAHARTWAEELAKRDMLMHSNRTLPDGSTVGENIYSCWSSGSLDIKAKTVMRNWYNEIENYDFKRAEFSIKSGRFTQMIWKDTKEFGIAKARSGDGSVYIVAIYRPTGNVTGLFETNVLPVLGHDIDARSESSSSIDSFDYDQKYAELLTQRANREVIKLDNEDTEDIDENLTAT